MLVPGAPCVAEAAVTSVMVVHLPTIRATCPVVRDIALTELHPESPEIFIAFIILLLLRLFLLLIIPINIVGLSGGDKLVLHID